MAVTDAMENRLLDALLPILNGIGTPSSNWLTTPIVAEGIPPDSIDEIDTKPRIYLQHVRSERLDGQMGVALHRSRAHFAIWIASSGPRVTNKVVADVLRALYAAEGSITTTFKQPFWAEDFSRRDDLSKPGIDVGVQPIFIDYETDHTSP